jgi:energy-coupling factor transporter ATP-binding protein EcfA2
MPRAVCYVNLRQVQASKLGGWQTMARIASFRIRGLAGRGKIISRPLRPDVNVFWGFNGSGKTSLLKILHSALRNDATSILRVPFTEATVVIIDDNGNRLIRTLDKSELPEVEQAGNEDDYVLLEAGSVFHRLNNPASSTVRWRGAGPEQSQASIPHSYLPISRVSEARTRGSRTRGMVELVDEAAFDKIFAMQIRDLWKEYNSQAITEINRAQDQGLAQILGLVLSGQVTGQQTSRPVIEDAQVAYTMVRQFLATQRMGAMMKLDRRRFLSDYGKNNLAQQVVAEVAEVLQIASRALEPQHEVENLITGLYAGGKRLEFHGGNVVVSVGDQAIPLESLSSGEKQLLQLLLECLAARSNPVLIDEPELSLHVDWQNRLIGNMRIVNNQSQLIMATHSPEVMANLADHHIFEL